MAKPKNSSNVVPLLPKAKPAKEAEVKRLSRDIGGSERNRALARSWGVMTDKQRDELLRKKNR